MLRDNKKMPRTPRREPSYGCPSYDYSDYNCPSFDYPMMPQYPHDMKPCPYPEEEMYGDVAVSVDEIMKRNDAFKKCIMKCVESYCKSSPCKRVERPRPTPKTVCRPKRRPQREPIYCEAEDYEFDYELDYDRYDDLVREVETYDFSENDLESFIEESQSDVEINDEE